MKKATINNLKHIQNALELHFVKDRISYLEHKGFKIDYKPAVGVVGSVGYMKNLNEVRVQIGYSEKKVRNSISFNYAFCVVLKPTQKIEKLLKLYLGNIELLINN